MRVSNLVNFIKARERHRVGRERGLKVARPDPIIAQYRFCNVRRNDDRVTKWIHEHYLTKWRDNPDLWFALIVARLFNQPETLWNIVECAVPFKIETMRRRLHQQKREGKKVFNAAYIVSTNGRAMDKVDYVLDLVLNPMWQARKLISSQINNVSQLANAHLLLEQQNGLGSFMAAQVVADLKYAHPERWEDFHTFAASGPGSRKGMNYVLGLPEKTPMAEDKFRATLAALRDAVNARLSMEPLTAHDIQNCLCEFSKYERTRLGTGKPKQLYTPRQS